MKRIDILSVAIIITSIIAILIILTGCKKEVINNNYNVEENYSTTVSIINATSYIDEMFNISKDSTLIGVNLGCNISVYNKFEVGHVYYLICFSSTQDTVATLIYDGDSLNIIDNPNFNEISLKSWGYCWDLESLKLY